MKPWKNVFILCILFCLPAGCRIKRDLTVPSQAHKDLTSLSASTQELIVLLPDPDGKVGTIQVTTERGSQVLEKPGYATRVESSAKQPNPPEPLDENEITDIFGVALTSQPDMTGRFVSFILYFEGDSTKLTQESQKVLTEILGTIRNRKSGEVYVIGHTDRVGTEEYNRGLSSRRANFVRDQLLSGGITPSALVVSFHGEAMPLVKTEDEVAEPLNRRVEVIVR